MPDSLQLQCLHGTQIKPFLKEIATCRIRVFRDFPYLYEGDPDYEAEYLRMYHDSPQSLVVLVRDGETVVGASTALPLEEAEEDFRKPFLEKGLEPTQYLYLGESVLLPAYRGRGLGHRFFDLREKHAQELQRPYTTFCAVLRPADHPMRPADYRPLDPFWKKRGYRAHPEL
ncbi:MAG: GNAT family N-acetyltransferase, partial [Verrucomicrobia bacterium]|nr:GNAT family N-acetyltransferase [Verrucomicrobiota bacterium]